MTHKCSALFLAAVIVQFCGCHEYVDPWTDETVAPELITTASVEGYRTPEVEQPVRTRQYDVTPISAEDGTVWHFPLWWQDPFEDRGSEDGQFAWTWEDYFAMPYGLGRYILNTLAVPVSAVLEPPVPLMASDGVISRQALGPDHDPLWLPSGGPSTPRDILDIGSVPP